MSEQKPSLTYRDAGVDIDAGNELVNRIKDTAARTRRPEVLGGLGGFGAMVSIPAGYQEPVLVSGTDGVGTKLRLAMQLGKHDSIGIDLVAMCVNDLVVGGAERSSGPFGLTISLSASSSVAAERTARTARLVVAKAYHARPTPGQCDTVVTA